MPKITISIFSVKPVSEQKVFECKKVFSSQYRQLENSIPLAYLNIYTSTSFPVLTSTHLRTKVPSICPLQQIVQHSHCISARGPRQSATNSSNFRAQISLGMVPIKSLSCTSSLFKFFNNPSCVGIRPSNVLAYKSSSAQGYKEREWIGEGWFKANTHNIPSISLQSYLATFSVQLNR